MTDLQRSHPDALRKQHLPIPIDDRPERPAQALGKPRQSLTLHRDTQWRLRQIQHSRRSLLAVSSTEPEETAIRTSRLLSGITTREENCRHSREVRSGLRRSPEVTSGLLPSQQHERQRARCGVHLAGAALPYL